MARRLFDIICAILALVVLSPLFAMAALGIRLSSRGPILYRARRVGLHGRLFTLYKFRSMHVDQGAAPSVITANQDPRIFAFGSLLRFLKIDELPQLVNILKGDMTIIGPRPEDPHIVTKYYSATQKELLRVLPGLSSPASIYEYTHAEQSLPVEDTEEHYLQHVMPLKLALDLVYVRERSFGYGLRIIFRTCWVILAKTLGKRRFHDPPEMQKAIELGQK